MSQAITIDTLEREVANILKLRTARTLSLAIDHVLGDHAIDASEWAPLWSVLYNRQTATGNGFYSFEELGAPAPTLFNESEIEDWIAIPLSYKADFGEAATNAFNHFRIPFSQRSALRSKYGKMENRRSQSKKQAQKEREERDRQFVGKLFEDSPLPSVPR
jgi:hypothetical protein